MKKKKLVIVGDSSFAQVAYEYFTYDSEYEVAAFSVEKKFISQSELFGLPIIPFEELTIHYPPEGYEIFVAIVYTQLNRLRTRLYQEAKQKGYRLASYISKHAFVWSNSRIGEHCFIFENNVIQPFVKIGNNVILWSGNHIGHHSEIKDNCFISSQVVISGHCIIGENGFFGVNSTVGDQVSVGKNALVGAGALILKSCEPQQVFKGMTTSPAGISSLKVAKVAIEA